MVALRRQVRLVAGAPSFAKCPLAGPINPVGNGGRAYRNDTICTTIVRAGLGISQRALALSRPAGVDTTKCRTKMQSRLNKITNAQAGFIPASRADASTCRED